MAPVLIGALAGALVALLPALALRAARAGSLRTSRAMLAALAPFFLLQGLFFVAYLLCPQETAPFAVAAVLTFLVIVTAAGLIWGRER